jgi:hypothetical protein
MRKLKKKKRETRRLNLSQLPVEEVDVKSDSSDEQEVCEDVPNLPETRAEFISELEEKSNTVPISTTR